MDLRAHLIRGFDYDVWATRRWIGALPLFPDQTRPDAILQHLYFAQRIWLIRAHEWLGLDVPNPPEEWSEEGFAELAASHKQLLLANDLEIKHAWTRRDGLKRETSLSSLAHHVINHGTYHRGHLRGLAEAAGIEDFPDTDLIFFEDEGK